MNQITKKSIATLMVATGAGIIVVVNVCKGKSDKPSNILYIMADDHTAQMIGCYGYNNIETPNLDRIAKDGVRFVNSFVANSISGPSRACMLTGKHSHMNGFYDNRMDSHFDGSQQTYPKLLQQAGYTTAVIGKWHLNSTPTGFDHWEIIPGQGDYYNPDFQINGDEIVKSEGYITNIITEKCVEWLDKERDKDKPFCLLMHHKAPHRNWMSDTTYLELYEDRIFDIPDTFYDDYEGRIAAQTQEMSIAEKLDLLYDLKMYHHNFDSKKKQTYDRMYSRMNSAQKAAWDSHYNAILEELLINQPTGNELAEWKFQRYMRDYAKTIKSVDDSIGEILDYLEANDLLDNTLVVYTSDQGFYMGEHGWFDKRFMYEESLNTPLLMKLPKSYKRRGVVEQMVQNIDYAPTFLELAGVDIPDDIQGESMLPLLSGQDDLEWRDAIYYHYYEYPGAHDVKRHYGVRTERYKLIHFYNDIDVWELYDLETDPQELHNIYDKERYGDVIETLEAKLAELQNEYNVPEELIK